MMSTATSGRMRWRKALRPGASLQRTHEPRCLTTPGPIACFKAWVVGLGDRKLVTCLGIFRGDVGVVVGQVAVVIPGRSGLMRLYGDGRCFCRMESPETSNRPGGTWGDRAYTPEEARSCEVEIACMQMPLQSESCILRRKLRHLRPSGCSCGFSDLGTASGGRKSPTSKKTSGSYHQKNQLGFRV